MHPNHNYRHSRRSACDRCRGQKLRCERDLMNGMSCERCLKAQEICVTSVNQPAPVMLPSNHSQNLVPRERERRRFPNGHESTPLIHKSSGPRANKPFNPPPPTIGVHSTEDYSYWRGSTSTPFLTGGNMISPPENSGLNIPMDFANVFIPYEQWGDQNPLWSTDPHSLYSEHMQLDQIYSNEQAIHCHTNYNPQNENSNITNTVSQNLQAQPLNNESFFTQKEPPGLEWGDFSGFASSSESVPMPTYRSTSISPQGLRRGLLKLEMELLEDLELLEIGSTSLPPSSFLHDSFTLPIETLELPIYRLLNHSSCLLEIIQSLCAPTVETPNLTHSPFSKSQPDRIDDPSFIFQEAGGIADEDCNIMSPNDSGYHTTTTSPGQMASASVLKCDITIWLGVLEAHCTLVRIYRLVFTRLYQLFLIIPPSDAATILSLPSTQFGQFHLEGNLVDQVQSLIEWSCKMLADIDRALGFCLNQGDSNSTHEKHWSIVMREIVRTQEQDPSEMSLMNLIECLRQLVKAPLNI